MKFNELEEIMFKQGVSSLVQIARILDTTPQAVSNWKARNQVPYHILAKISDLKDDNSVDTSDNNKTIYQSTASLDKIEFSDILLTVAEQVKVITLILFVSVFFTFTYVQFIKQPQFVSWASVLLPSSQSGNIGGLSGIASQFGVNIPSQQTGGNDLSSPTLFPELLKSRVFAEKILQIEFFTEKHNKKLPLISILTDGTDAKEKASDYLVSKAVSELGGLLNFEQGQLSSISKISVIAPEPRFAKELADVVVKELEDLNRYFKNQAISEKRKFIENRISTVANDLDASEQRLMAFVKQNRQISAPALQLELDRLTRDVDVQKEIYLTLKQQLELTKIEEIQKSSIVQILDKPEIPLGPSNINLLLSTMFSGVFGLGLGILLAFLRAYVNNSDLDERRKLRRVRNFFNKKIKGAIIDKRISGIVSFLLLAGLPFYLGHESKNPTFFGLYSNKFMFVNTVYILVLLCSLFFFYSSFKRKNNK